MRKFAFDSVLAGRDICTLQGDIAATTLLYMLITLLLLCAVRIPTVHAQEVSELSRIIGSNICRTDYSKYKAPSMDECRGTGNRWHECMNDVHRRSVIIGKWNSFVDRCRRRAGTEDMQQNSRSSSGPVQVPVPAEKQKVPSQPKDWSNRIRDAQQRDQTSQGAAQKARSDYEADVKEEVAKNNAEIQKRSEQLERDLRLHKQRQEAVRKQLEQERAEIERQRPPVIPRPKVEIPQRRDCMRHPYIAVCLARGIPDSGTYQGVLDNCKGTLIRQNECDY
jgi:hypothetical protein